MGVSGVATFGVGVEMLPLRSISTLILPVWNMLIGLLMLMQMGFQKYDVSDEDASPGEVFLTTIILLFVLALADLVFHLSWPMILSVGIARASCVCPLKLILAYIPGRN